jgi:hypothetical protein
MEQVFQKIEDWGISIDRYEEDGKLCGYELNTYTDGGVNMIVFLDFRDGGDPQDPEHFINELRSYIIDIDIDELIDLHRQDKHYRDNFSIKGSLEDFENWREEMEQLEEELSKLL